MTRSSSLRLALVVLLAVPSASVAAQEWQVRLFGVLTEPGLNEEGVDGDGDTLRVRADSEINLGAAVEYSFSDRLGLEMGLLYGVPTVEVRIDTPDGLRFILKDTLPFRPITAALHWRLNPQGAARFYVGPVVAYVDYGDLEFTLAGESVRLESDDDVGVGAKVGVDLAPGRGRWSVGGAVQYLETDLSVTELGGEVTDLAFDPLLVTVGVGYRF